MKKFIRINIYINDNAGKVKEILLMILDFDRRVSEFVNDYESLLVVMCRIETLRIDTEHTGELLLPHFPDMEVSDLTVSISFDLCFDLFYDCSIRRPIDEDSGGISHEEIRPTEDED